MIRRISIAALVVVLLGLLGFWLLSQRPAIAPLERAGQESFSAGSVARGQVLAAAGHCASCHRARAGRRSLADMQ
jgi:mono/diheme cytochrome c family protein